MCQFELLELILLLKFDKQLPVERFEAAVSQSTVPSPLLGAVRQERDRLAAEHEQPDPVGGGGRRRCRDQA